MTKTFFKTKLLSLAIISILGLVACDNDDDDNVNPSGTITDIVVEDPDLSTLEYAVIKADLTTTLSGPGPFTLFAPTNDGFTNANLSTTDIDALSVGDVSNLLLYHVIPSEIPASAVPAGPNAPVITASGDSVFVTSNSNGVFVNGVQVVAADIDATNGIIHKLDNVLMPAVGDIVVTAQSDTALTYLVAAVLRASTGSIDVAAVLSGSDILSVFAPTNNAFRAAGFATIADINAADPDALAVILTYHVIAGRIFSSDLTDGAQPVTLNGAPVTISTSSGATVKGNTNTTASNIIKANVVATNGVVHLIDQVLLP